jgi:hypothetical protein
LWRCDARRVIRGVCGYLGAVRRETGWGGAGGDASAELWGQRAMKSVCGRGDVWQARRTGARIGDFREDEVWRGSYLQRRGAFYRLAAAG